MKSPGAVAVRPGTADGVYDVFVFERGAGRVVAVRSDQPGKPKEIVTGFSPAADGGSACLLCLGPRHLVVADGNGLARLHLFELDEEGQAVAVEQAAQSVDFNKPAGDSAANHVGAITRSRANDRVPDMLLAAVGQEDRGQLWKVPLRADTLGEPARFDATSPDELASITAFAVSEHGFLVAAHTIAENETNRVQLRFYNPLDGSEVLRRAVELEAIRGLAYSPRTGNLYAAGIAGGDGNRGGIYRIDDASRPGKPACTAIKIAETHEPTALAFGPDGLLFVTARSDTDANGLSSGTLQKISGDL